MAAVAADMLFCSEWVRGRSAVCQRLARLVRIGSANDSAFRVKVVFLLIPVALTVCTARRLSALPIVHLIFCSFHMT